MHEPRLPGGFGFPLGFLASVVVTTGAVAAGATRHPTLAVLALAGVTIAIAAVSTSGATVGTAAVCWAMHAGFVLGRHGDLAFTARSTKDAVVLGAVAVIAALAAGVRRNPARVAIPVPRGTLDHIRPASRV